ncbi:MAG TPA: hypothetical protein VGG28_13970 [Kofleriaceae bacterium]|jgi:hypothetical protein
MRGLVAIALAGCVSRVDITHVVLRDLDRVAIVGGNATIMSIGSSAGEIPATAYLPAPNDGSYVERHADGAIVAWCPTCAGVQRRIVVGAPTLQLDGAPANVLRFDGDVVHIPWIFDELQRGHRQWIAVPRIALDIVTSRDNIASIDYERHVDTSGDSALGPAAFFMLGGGGIALGAYERQPVVEIVGAAVLAGAIAFAVCALRDHLAHDQHQAIAP